MILVDTSVIVAWLDGTHPNHSECAEALFACASRDELAVSSISYAELAAGGRTQEAVDLDLSRFRRVDLTFEAAWRAGVAFARFHPGKTEQQTVLPDFLIRAQAAVLDCPHLTNDHRRLRAFPEVEFIFPAR